ncbi:MAG: transglutaminase-like domain-containing protein [Gemmatimonadaceae bacterium]
MRRRTGASVALSLLLIAGLTLTLGRWSAGGKGKLPARAPIASPGVEYYAVSQNATQIGFASSAVDTSESGVQVSDYFLADLQTDGTTHRAWARVVARYTRQLHLRDFVLTLSPEIGPLRATGTVSGDSMLTLAFAVGNERPDTQMIRLPGPTILPNVVPLALTLSGAPRVGREHRYSVFDPMGQVPSVVTVRVVSDTFFVLPDSAVRDGERERWVPTGADTVRAWRIDGGALISGWIDARGRLVDGTLLGLMPLRRTAYELAYTNWSDDTRRNGTTISEDRDIQETTAIAASAPIRNKRSLPRLRVRLMHADLAGYDLRGARQTFSGDTLEIRRETAVTLRAAYKVPGDRAQFGATLAPEPLVQSDDPAIAALATRIAGGETDARVVGERINRWVHDSLEKKISFSIPNAAQVLRARSGDCNEHTQLYVALARAAGVPARSVAGLVYVGGKFYYHAWPEIYLGDWVATDPTFGQFPADAAHLRFVIGGFKRQAELLRLIGTLGIEVLK